MHGKIGQFEIQLILYAPSSLIATDIRTGFPSLMSSERKRVDTFIEKQWTEFVEDKTFKRVRPLSIIDEFLEILEPSLVKFYKQHQELELDSLAVSTYLNPYQPSIPPHSCSGNSLTPSDQNNIDKGNK